MAYPFPRSASAPRTPRSLLRGTQGSSRTVPPYKTRRRKRVTAGFVLFSCCFCFFSVMFLWCLTGPHRPSPSVDDRMPFSHEGVEDHVAHFAGSQTCGLVPSRLYLDVRSFSPPLPYCPTRRALLGALSHGGRNGFDAPYLPLGCHYRWYSTAETCMILERFDGLVFVGDEMLADVYAAFNMLLREDVASGGVRGWEMTEDERARCRCEGQLRAECRKRLVLDSEEEASRTNSPGSNPYLCQRMPPHFFLPIAGSPAPTTHRDRLTALLAEGSTSYKPVPVVHSLGLSTSLSYQVATSSMDEWLTVADASGRLVPYLWVGPNAAGYLKPPSLLLSQGNSALWHYTLEMAREVARRDGEALAMWNMTVQAASWDGTGYGLGVALVQAMMIVNWLARVEST